VICAQNLDERNKRVRTDGRAAQALCLKLDWFVEGKPRDVGADSGAERARRTKHLAKIVCCCAKRLSRAKTDARQQLQLV
jgi:hypothetical protein